MGHYSRDLDNSGLGLALSVDIQNSVEVPGGPLLDYRPLEEGHGDSTAAITVATSLEFPAAAIVQAFGSHHPHILEPS